MNIRSYIVLPLITAFAAISGCSTSALAVREDYLAPAPVRSGVFAPSAAQRKDCYVHLMKLGDSRVDPTILGAVGGRSVRSPGPDWIKNMLYNGLRDKGVTLSFAPAAADANAQVLAEARLVTAWVGSTATSMNGTVVIAIRDRKDAEERIFRGAVTTVNWANGDGEIQSLVDQAFERMLLKLSSDLRGRCKGISG